MTKEVLDAVKSAEDNPYLHLTRQMDLIHPDLLKERINIIGCGAIGSVAALALAEMGFTNFHLWDDDEVDTVNMNAQFYGHEDIGKPKVIALADHLRRFGWFKGEANKGLSMYHRKWQPDLDKDPLKGVVITAVDSMEARRAIWETHQTSSETTLIIDPRMAAEYLIIQAFDPLDSDLAEAYSASLTSDAETVQERCTAKATSYTSFGAGSLIAMLIKQFLTRESADTPYPSMIEWFLTRGVMRTYMNTGMTAEAYQEALAAEQEEASGNGSAQ